MLILPDYKKPYILENSSAPIVPKHFWVFSAALMDFTLANLNFLEELHSTTVTVEIDGFKLKLPYNWYILICSPETNQLDYIQISECITIQNSAFLMSPDDSIIRTSPIKILDIQQDQYSYFPMIQKTHAMCHPVREIKDRNGAKSVVSIVVGPHDLYKFIADKHAGDFF